MKEGNTIIDLTEVDEMEYDANSISEKELDEAIEVIGNKCKQNELQYSVETLKYEDDEDEYNEVQVVFKSGREGMPLSFHSRESIVALSKIDFEQYGVFHEYSGVFSYLNKRIEVYLQMPNRMPLSFITRRLIGEATGENKLSVFQSVEGESVRIEVSPPSNELLVLSQGFIRPLNRGQLSIKIENINISTYEKTTKLLIDVSNALFFQIDLCKNMTFMLSRMPVGNTRVLKRNQLRNTLPIKFPTNLFDNEAISLYWYAKSSTGIPLLQFLAFYQSIEYYFPLYSEVETKRLISNILKDPTFNFNNDKDINRLFNTIIIKFGKSFDTERAQLKATLKECVSIIGLREYIFENEELKNFYSGSEWKKLSNKKIISSLNDEELFNNISDRIYDVRCKIVHTKGGDIDGNIELLLPFSKEVEYLYYDIALIQYIAQQILISNSKALYF